MLIFIAGLPGSGKSTLADAVAKRLHFVHFELDEIKKELYPKLDPEWKQKLDSNIPLHEDVDENVHQKAMEDLLRLGKTDIVIDEMFYRKDLRDLFFRFADTHLGGHIMVWVRPSDSVVKGRLEAGERSGHLLKDPFGTYLVFKEKFDPVDDADVIVTNEGSIEESVEQILACVRTKHL